MISYNSQKFNNLIKQISQILKVNNIDSTDSEIKIPTKISELITSKIQLCIEPADNFLSEKCPKCGKTHFTVFSSSYFRNVIFKIDNLLIKIKVAIPRLICTNCNSTHAVLPEFCIPLKQYSKQAILEIASIASKSSSQAVADVLNIDSKQVRRFINLVKKQINAVNLLKNILNFKFKNFTKLHTFIKYLPKNISKIYFENFNTIFLYELSNRNLYLRYAKLSI